MEPYIHGDLLELDEQMPPFRTRHWGNSETVVTVLPPALKLPAAAGSALVLLSMLRSALQLAPPPLLGLQVAIVQPLGLTAGSASKAYHGPTIVSTRPTMGLVWRLVGKALPTEWLNLAQPGPSHQPCSTQHSTAQA